MAKVHATFAIFFIYLSMKMMVKIILCSIICLMSFQADAQDKGIRFVVSGGPSLYGTGDLPGYVFSNEVQFSLGRRFFLSPGLSFSSHADERYLTNYEFRFVTTGITVFTNLNLLLFHKNKHTLALGAGPVFRIQQRSAPDEYGQGLGSSGNQEVFFSYEGPMQTTAFGYNIAPSYLYRISSKVSLGARYLLQNDTHGDIITSGLLTIGLHL
jgi:hypothetical protein